MKRIEKKIERFASYDVPDVLSQIMPPETSKFRLKPVLTFALSLVFIVLASLPFILPAQDLEASAIYLDFDTALRLSLNDNDEVIEIDGLNLEGERFVALLKENPQWQNESLERFLERLMTTIMTRPSQPMHGALLYSVRSENPSIEARLHGQMQRQLGQSNNPVFDDVVEGEAPTMQSGQTPDGMMANPVRARLIQQIRSMDSTLNESDLNQMALNELLKIGRELGITPGQRP